MYENPVSSNDSICEDKEWHAGVHDQPEPGSLEPEAPQLPQSPTAVQPDPADPTHHWCIRPPIPKVIIKRYKKDIHKDMHSGGYVHRGFQCKRGVGRPQAGGRGRGRPQKKFSLPHNQMSRPVRKRQNINYAEEDLDVKCKEEVASSGTDEFENLFGRTFSNLSLGNQTEHFKPKIRRYRNRRGQSWSRRFSLENLSCLRTYRLSKDEWLSGNCEKLLTDKYRSLSILLKKKPVVVLKRLPRDVEMAADRGLFQLFDFDLKDRFGVEENRTASHQQDAAASETLQLVDPKVISLSRTLQGGERGEKATMNKFFNATVLKSKKPVTSMGPKTSKKVSPKEWSKIRLKLKEINVQTTRALNDDKKLDNLVQSVNTVRAMKSSAVKRCSSEEGGLQEQSVNRSSHVLSHCESDSFTEHQKSLSSGTLPVLSQFTSERKEGQSESAIIEKARYLETKSVSRSGDKNEEVRPVQSVHDNPAWWGEDEVGDVMPRSLTALDNCDDAVDLSASVKEGTTLRAKKTGQESGTNTCRTRDVEDLGPPTLTPINLVQRSPHSDAGLEPADRSMLSSAMRRHFPDTHKNPTAADKGRMPNLSHWIEKSQYGGGMEAEDSYSFITDKRDDNLMDQVQNCSVETISPSAATSDCWGLDLSQKTFTEGLDLRSPRKQSNPVLETCPETSKSSHLHPSIIDKCLKSSSVRGLPKTDMCNTRPSLKPLHPELPAGACSESQAASRDNNSQHFSSQGTAWENISDGTDISEKSPAKNRSTNPHPSSSYSLQDDTEMTSLGSNEGPPEERLQSQHSASYDSDATYIYSENSDDVPDSCFDEPGAQSPSDKLFKAVRPGRGPRHGCVEPSRAVGEDAETDPQDLTATADADAGASVFSRLGKERRRDKDRKMRSVMHLKYGTVAESPTPDSGMVPESEPAPMEMAGVETGQNVLLAGQKQPVKRKHRRRKIGKEIKSKKERKTLEVEKESKIKLEKTDPYSFSPEEEIKKVPRKRSKKRDLKDTSLLSLDPDLIKSGARETIKEEKPGKTKRRRRSKKAFQRELAIIIEQDDADDLPTIFPPKRRKRSTVSPAVDSPEDGLVKMERLMADFPKHNWLFNKYSSSPTEEEKPSLPPRPQQTGPSQPQPQEAGPVGTDTSTKDGSQHSLVMQGFDDLEDAPLCIDVKEEKAEEITATSLEQKDEDQDLDHSRLMEEENRSLNKKEENKEDTCSDSTEKQAPLDLCVSKTDVNSVNFRQRPTPPVHVVLPQIHKPPATTTESSPPTVIPEEEPETENDAKPAADVRVEACTSESNTALASATNGVPVKLSVESGTSPVQLSASVIGDSNPVPSSPVTPASLQNAFTSIPSLIPISAVNRISFQQTTVATRAMPALQQVAIPAGQIPPLVQLQPIGQIPDAQPVNQIQQVGQIPAVGQQFILSPFQYSTSTPQSPTITNIPAHLMQVVNKAGQKPQVRLPLGQGLQLGNVTTSKILLLDHSRKKSVVHSPRQRLLLPREGESYIGMNPTLNSVPQGQVCATSKHPVLQSSTEGKHPEVNLQQSTHGLTSNSYFVQEVKPNASREHSSTDVTQETGLKPSSSEPASSEPDVEKAEKDIEEEFKQLQAMIEANEKEKEQLEMKKKMIAEMRLSKKRKASHTDDDQNEEPTTPSSRPEKLAKGDSDRIQLMIVGSDIYHKASENLTLPDQFFDDTTNRSETKVDSSETCGSNQHDIVNDNIESDEHGKDTQESSGQNSTLTPEDPGGMDMSLVSPETDSPTSPYKPHLALTNCSRENDEKEQSPCELQIEPDAEIYDDKSSPFDLSTKPQTAVMNTTEPCSVERIKLPPPLSLASELASDNSLVLNASGPAEESRNPVEQCDLVTFGSPPVHEKEAEHCIMEVQSENCLNSSGHPAQESCIEDGEEIFDLSSKPCAKEAKLCGSDTYVSGAENGPLQGVPIKDTITAVKVHENDVDVSIHSRPTNSSDSGEISASTIFETVNCLDLSGKENTCKDMSKTSCELETVQTDCVIDLVQESVLEDKQNTHTTEMDLSKPNCPPGVQPVTPETLSSPLDSDKVEGKQPSLLSMDGNSVQTDDGLIRRQLLETETSIDSINKTNKEGTGTKGANPYPSSQSGPDMDRIDLSAQTFERFSAQSGGLEDPYERPYDSAGCNYSINKPVQTNVQSRPHVDRYNNANFRDIAHQSGIPRQQMYGPQRPAPVQFSRPMTMHTNPQFVNSRASASAGYSTQRFQGSPKRAQHHVLDQQAHPNTSMATLTSHFARGLNSRRPLVPTIIPAHVKSSPRKIPKNVPPFPAHSTRINMKELLRKTSQTVCSRVPLQIIQSSPFYKRKKAVLRSPEDLETKRPMLSGPPPPAHSQPAFNIAGPLIVQGRCGRNRERSVSSDSATINYTRNTDSRIPAIPAAQSTFASDVEMQSSTAYASDKEHSDLANSASVERSVNLSRQTSHPINGSSGMPSSYLPVNAHVNGERSTNIDTTSVLRPPMTSFRNVTTAQLEGVEIIDLTKEPGKEVVKETSEEMLIQKELHEALAKRQRVDSNVEGNSNGNSEIKATGPEHPRASIQRFAGQNPVTRDDFNRGPRTMMQPSQMQMDAGQHMLPHAKLQNQMKPNMQIQRPMHTLHPNQLPLDNVQRGQHVQQMVQESAGKRQVIQSNYASMEQEAFCNRPPPLHTAQIQQTNMQHDRPMHQDDRHSAMQYSRQSLNNRRYGFNNGGKQPVDSQTIKNVLLSQSSEVQAQVHMTSGQSRSLMHNQNPREPVQGMQYATEGPYQPGMLRPQTLKLLGSAVGPAHQREGDNRYGFRGPPVTGMQRGAVPAQMAGRQALHSATSYQQGHYGNRMMVPTMRGTDMVDNRSIHHQGRPPMRSSATGGQRPAHAFQRSPHTSSQHTYVGDPQQMPSGNFHPRPTGFRAQGSGRVQTATPGGESLASIGQQHMQTQRVPQMPSPSYQRTGTGVGLTGTTLGIRPTSQTPTVMATQPHTAISPQAVMQRSPPTQLRPNTTSTTTTIQQQPSPEVNVPHLQQIHGTCIMCGKFSLYLCSSCKKIWYCSPQCQLSHWTTHSAECRGNGS